MYTPVDDYIIHKDFPGEFGENIFHEYIVHDMKGLAINANNLNMEGDGAHAGPRGPQRMVVVDPINNLGMVSGERTEVEDNHHDAFDDNLER